MNTILEQIEDEGKELKRTKTRVRILESNVNSLLNPAVYQVGRKIATAKYQFQAAATGSSGGQSSATLTSGYAQASLFEIEKSVSISDIVIRVVTLETGKTARLGFAKPASDGTVGKIIYETSAFSLGATGAVTITETISLLKGWYYIIIISDATTAAIGTIVNGASPLSFVTDGTSNGTGAVCRARWSHTFANPLTDNPANQDYSFAGASFNGAIGAIFTISALL